MTFDEAVEQYTTYLLKISYLYVKDRSLAEDIVQEVFIKLYLQHGEEIPFTNAKGYITQMTVNRCSDYFKSWHYRKVTFTSIIKPFEGRLEVNEESDLIDTILKLPLKYREVIILYYYDEQNSTEIASLLNVPISTVKSRLQKGRQLLKGFIEEEGVAWHEAKN